MQILRYIVHIWEDYEKEMNKKFPEISRRKGFKYPPVLPIIYYEGKQRWTAPLDILLEIMARIYRALLYNMGIPEEETEKAVATIKERKKARLFENVPKNFEADRKKAEKADIRKEFTIYRYVNKLLKSQKTESEIIASLASGFLLEREEAERALKKVLEEDT